MFNKLYAAYDDFKYSHGFFGGVLCLVMICLWSVQFVSSFQYCDLSYKHLSFQSWFDTVQAGSCVFVAVMFVKLNAVSIFYIIYMASFRSTLNTCTSGCRDWETMFFLYVLYVYVCLDISLIDATLTQRVTKRVCCVHNSWVVTTTKLLQRFYSKICSVCSSLSLSA